MASALQAFDEGLHDTSQPWHKIFDWAEARSGVHRLKIFGFIVITIAGWMVFGYGSAVLSNIVGFSYPAYTSLKMARSAQQNTVTDESNRTDYSTMVSGSSRWLTYWLVFSTVLMIEQVFGWILRMLPFYHLIKTLFLIWCFVNVGANGAEYMYASIIHRYFGKLFGIPDNSSPSAIEHSTGANAYK